LRAETPRATLEGMKRALLVLLLAVGCGSLPEWETPNKPDVKPGDNAFAKRAWEAWGNRGFDRPDLLYIEGADLNCNEGRGFLEYGECRGGSFDQQTFVARIAWSENAELVRFRIVHEFCHASYDDQSHDRECAMTPGNMTEVTLSRLAP